MNRCLDFFDSCFVVHPTSRDIRNQRINFSDFEPIKTLGRGAYGTVDLVRSKSVGQVYAMKTLSKFEMVKEPSRKTSRFSPLFPLVKTFGQCLLLGRTKHHGFLKQ